MSDPLVNKPPERDPFLDQLFSPEVGGIFLAAVIAVLAIAVVIKRRRDRAREWEEFDGAEDRP